MPANCRPDITLRKVWGNIEKCRYEKGIGYNVLAKAMHISVPLIYKRKEDPTNLRIMEILYAAKYFGVEVEELFR